MLWNTGRCFETLDVALKHGAFLCYKTLDVALKRPMHVSTSLNGEEEDEITSFQDRSILSAVKKRRWTWKITKEQETPSSLNSHPWVTYKLSSILVRFRRFCRFCPFWNQEVWVEKLPPRIFGLQYYEATTFSQWAGVGRAGWGPNFGWEFEVQRVRKSFTNSLGKTAGAIRERFLNPLYPYATTNPPESAGLNI